MVVSRSPWENVESNKETKTHGQKPKTPQKAYGSCLYYEGDMSHMLERRERMLLAQDNGRLLSVPLLALKGEQNSDHFRERAS